MLKKIQHFLCLLFMSFLLVGCGNIFESLEDIDIDDQKSIAEQAKEDGDYGAAKEAALEILNDLGVDYNIPAVGSSPEEKEARVDVAESVLNELGAAPVDFVIGILDSSDSDDDFFIDLSDNIPPTSNKNEVLKAASNLRMNVNTDDNNDVMLAAAAEINAVMILLKDSFVVSANTGALDPSANAELTTANTLLRWDTVSSNVIEHAIGAISMFDVLLDEGDGDDIDDARTIVDDLNDLNSQRGSLTDDQFVASFNALLGFE